MIRLLHFAHVVNYEDFVDSLLRRLDESRYESRVLLGRESQRPAPPESPRPYAVRVMDLDVQKRANYPVMFATILSEIRRFRPDVLHVHHFDENLVAALAVHLARVPAYVLHRHYSDQIHRTAKGLRLGVFLAAENFANRTATRIVAHVPETRDLLVQQGVDRDKIEIVIHGTVFDRLQAPSSDSRRRVREDLAIGDGPMILYCGRLVAIKAVDVLLRAFAISRKRHPAAVLAIAGEGPERNALRTLAAELGIAEGVKFLGWRNDVADLMAASDLLVNPSRSEGYSQVVVEALWMMVPLVATAVGIAPRAIGDDERGALVSAGSVDALALAIDARLSDPSGARRKAKDGREWVREHLGVERMVARMDEIYTSLAPGRSSK